MSDFNFDKNTMNKIKNMMNNGELNDVISQIPPDMIENFNSIINNNSNSTANSNNSNNSSNGFDTINTHNNSKQTNLNNLDMNAILKMKSIIDNMNNNNDPRSNLLHSLKPYLRDSRREKIDQYANLLNFAQMAELFKKDSNTNNDNKE